MAMNTPIYPQKWCPSFGGHGFILGMGELFYLDNPIQHYAWGSHETLAKMRGVPAPTEQPEAELWVGAHSSAPSVAQVDGGKFPLDTLVAQQPGRFLNPKRSSDYFPFLFKILAIESPLSIQVHPTDEQALAGFADENERGVALDNPARNYKDQFSKPETVIALTPLRILTGVRDFTELRGIADTLKLNWLAGALNQAKTPKELLTAVIRMPQDAATAAVQKTVKAAAKWAKKHKDAAGADSAIAGVTELVELLDRKYPGDRGLLVAVTMNLMHLAPGEAAFTPDGQVHAYVSGTAIELMNPSDNVLRAGLTPKHVDEEELIRVLGEQQNAPAIQRPVEGTVATYSMWDERLSVTRVRLAEGEALTLPVSGLATVLCTGGSMTVSNDQATFTLGGTQAVMYVGEAGQLTLTGTGELYIAAQV